MCRRAATKAGWDKARIDAVVDEMMAGNYGHLLATAKRYWRWYGGRLVTANADGSISINARIVLEGRAGGLFVASGAEGLIEAAPALYEACMRALRGEDAGFLLAPGTADELRAALAKAEGRTEDSARTDSTREE